jgi:hypothetical protein
MTIFVAAQFIAPCDLPETFAGGGLSAETHAAQDGLEQ